MGSLERRIGGMAHGSGSYVWQLDAPGDHLLRLNDQVIRPRRKQFEPSRFFLAHTLAVSECYVSITEICDGKYVQLTEIQNEPDNWRPYNSGGKLVTLKPDLAAVTICGGYEDQWFFEVDLATESPIKIIEKCRRYLKYYLSGVEQKQFGVFPLVVFLVPDAKRKESISHHIRTEFAKMPNLFLVITPDELRGVIRQEVGNGNEYVEIRTKLGMALALLEDCGKMYRQATDDVKRMMNQAMFERILVGTDGAVEPVYTRVYWLIFEPYQEADEPAIAHDRLASMARPPRLIDFFTKTRNTDLKTSHFFGRCFIKTIMVGLNGLAPSTFTMSRSPKGTILYNNYNKQSLECWLELGLVANFNEVQNGFFVELERQNHRVKIIRRFMLAYSSKYEAHVEASLMHAL